MMGEPVYLWLHGHVHNSNDYYVNGTGRGTQLG